MLVIVRYSVTVKPNLFTPQSWASDPVLAHSALSQSPALWLMRIRHASLTVLVADVQGQAPGWSGEGPFLVADFSLCPHEVGGATELPGVSFMRSLIPLVEAPPSCPHPFPEAPPPNAVTLGIRF